jgi:hypothetical protein
MTDHALDALLAEYAPPPPSVGLAVRVIAAALALPQEPRRAAAGPRHDRRRAWLRRPMVIGGIALGLAVSGAVAATLAGLPGVEAVWAKVIGREPAPEPALPRALPEIAPPVPAPAPAQDEPAVARRVPAPAAPATPATRDEVAPVIVPEAAPRRAEIPEIRRIEMPPPPVVRQEEAPPAVVPERPAPPPQADEQLRPQREQIERAERLRAARQAQIERMQRLQQSRERIRRLRRD